MPACMHQGHAHSKDPVIQLVAVQLPQARHQGREFRDTSVYILRMVVDMCMFYLVCFLHIHIYSTHACTFILYLHICVNTVVVICTFLHICIYILTYAHMCIHIFT